MENKTVYIIAGPTAVGKSDVAYYLAKRIGGEIVNCDSVQLYKYMDIGTAKPSEEEMAAVPHHLYGIVEPDYNMTVATYQKLALTTINNILSRGKTPIVTGGTGLYLNSILYDMNFAGVSNDGGRRAELEKMAEENGNEYMHNYLEAIDPVSAERIHPNNLRKVIRAIEAYETGEGIKPMDNCTLNSDYDFRFCVLNMDRAWLYSRINYRVDKLIKAGLVDEVDKLLAMGYGSDTPSMKSIGYKEIIAYRNGEYDLDTAIEEIRKNTRHYAKRQLTWLRRYDNAEIIEIHNGESVGNLLDRIVGEAR